MHGNWQRIRPAGLPTCPWKCSGSSQPSPPIRPSPARLTLRRPRNTRGHIGSISPPPEAVDPGLEKAWGEARPAEAPSGCLKRAPTRSPTPPAGGRRQGVRRLPRSTHRTRPIPPRAPPAGLAACCCCSVLVLPREPGLPFAPHGSGPAGLEPFAPRVWVAGEKSPKTPARDSGVATPQPPTASDCLSSTGRACRATELLTR